MRDVRGRTCARAYPARRAARRLTAARVYLRKAGARSAPLARVRCSRGRSRSAPWRAAGPADGSVRCGNRHLRIDADASWWSATSTMARIARSSARAQVSWTRTGRRGGDPVRADLEAAAPTAAAAGRRNAHGPALSRSRARRAVARASRGPDAATPCRTTSQPRRRSRPRPARESRRPRDAGAFARCSSARRRDVRTLRRRARS